MKEQEDIRLIGIKFLDDGGIGIAMTEALWEALNEAARQERMRSYATEAGTVLNFELGSPERGLDERRFAARIALNDEPCYPPKQGGGGGSGGGGG